MKRLQRVAMFFSAAMAIPIAALSQSATTVAERSGRQLYQAACQSCHGATGTGMERSHVGFADVIPDFTDCSYASREAAQDWQGIVRNGGPSRRFSQRMPAFGGALTSAEIERVVDYVRSLCTERAWPRGELNLPRPMDLEKAFPEDELVIESNWTTTKGQRAATTSFIFEKRVGARNQWELVVPVSTRENPVGADARWTGVHVGDISLAIKRAVLHGSSSILSLGAEAIFPTGDKTSGLGEGTLIYEPFFLAAQTLPANFYLQLHGGAELPAKKDVMADEGFLRAAFGTTFFIGGRSFSPMAEGIAVRPLTSGSSNAYEWIPQVQVSLSRRQHILGSFGVRLPITERATRSREFVAYFLWDWFDGPLLGGW